MKSLNRSLFKFLPVCLMAAICLGSWAGCTATSTNQKSFDQEDATLHGTITFEILGKEHTLPVDEEGRLKDSIELTSADGSVSILLYQDTVFLDSNGKQIQTVQVSIDDSLLLPSEDVQIVGNVYKLSPEGTSVEPSPGLSLSYDPALLPEEVNERDVYISGYSASTGWSTWQYRRVDTDNHQVTTKLNTFSRVAVLAPLPVTPTQSPTAAENLTAKSLSKALSSGKPTLAEFGWRTCIPCIEMKPILEELAVEYEGKLNVVIVEVYEQQDVASQYGIRGIPTQILFDSRGKEVMRHSGLWPKAEIISELKKKGIY